MEHPRLAVGRIHFRKDQQTTDFYDSRFAVMNLPALAEIGLRESSQRREGLLDWTAHIEALPRGRDSEGVASLMALHRCMKLRALPQSPARHLWRIAADAPNLARFLLGYRLRFDHFIEDFEIVAKVEQCPNPESRISLSNERDNLGMLKACLDWRLTDLDRRTFRRGLEILDEELTLGGFTGLELTPPYATGPNSSTPTGTWHHMGTTRMNEKPSEGVVDANCRVHGLSNLFIAGSSVFPTAGRNAPTLTIVALSVRLGDHIKAVLPEL